MRPLKEKISITIDSDILEIIREEAEQDDRSLSQYINIILKEHIKAKVKWNYQFKLKRLPCLKGRMSPQCGENVAQRQKGTATVSGWQNRRFWLRDCYKPKNTPQSLTWQLPSILTYVKKKGAFGLYTTWSNPRQREPISGNAAV